MDELYFSEDEINQINMIKEMRDIVFSDKYNEVEFSSSGHYARQRNAFAKASMDRSKSFDSRRDLLNKAGKAQFNLQRKIQSHNARFNDTINRTRSSKKKCKVLIGDADHNYKLAKLNNKYISMLSNNKY